MDESVLRHLPRVIHPVVRVRHQLDGALAAERACAERVSGLMAAATSPIARSPLPSPAVRLVGQEMDRWREARSRREEAERRVEQVSARLYRRILRAVDAWVDDHLRQRTILMAEAGRLLARQPHWYRDRGTPADEEALAAAIGRLRRVEEDALLLWRVHFTWFRRARDAWPPAIDDGMPEVVRAIERLDRRLRAMRSRRGHDAGTAESAV